MAIRNRSCHIRPCEIFILFRKLDDCFFGYGTKAVHTNINDALIDSELAKFRTWCTSLPYGCEHMRRHAVTLITMIGHVPSSEGQCHVLEHQASEHAAKVLQAEFFFVYTRLTCTYILR